MYIIGMSPKKLNGMEDDIQRLRYACDLRLTGIPYSHNENLLDIYNTLSTIIGFDTSNTAFTPILERLPIRNKATGVMIASSTILIHFSSIQHKNWFYSLYLNKMPLKGETFGLQNGKNVILGENLTPKNANVFKLAKQFKANNKLAQVFTQDGLIKIRFVRGANNKTFTLRTVTELNYLVEQHNQIGMDVESNTNTASLHSNVQPHVQETLNQIANAQPANCAHALTHLGQCGLNGSVQHTCLQQQKSNESTSQPTQSPNQQNNQTEGTPTPLNVSQHPKTTHTIAPAQLQHQQQQQPETT